jgi:hypothetical protein
MNVCICGELDGEGGNDLNKFGILCVFSIGPRPGIDIGTVGIF